jgi:uncharacterized protein (DUF2236 family)
MLSRDKSHLLGSDELERQLDIVRARAAGSLAGVFGPDSLTWRVNREAIVFLGAGRALLLQLAHPWVAAAIAEHSRTLADRIGRFHRTFSTVFALVFGTLDQSFAVARRLHRSHAAIHGLLPAPAGPFSRGSAYAANDVAALRWVYATLTETSLLAHDLVLPALLADERERYYDESKMFAALFGIHRCELPADWTGFVAFNEMLLDSDTLTVSAEAKAISRQLLAGGQMRLRVPGWYLAITARLLPPRLREAFALPYGNEERRSAERAISTIRRAYASLPEWLRYVSPYQEAMLRVSRRAGPNLRTRLLNRLWIGRSRLDA